MTEFIIKVLLPSGLSSDPGLQPEEHHSPVPIPHWQLRPPQTWCSALSMLSAGKGTSHWARCHTTEYKISMNNIIDRAVASTWFCSLWFDKQSHRDSSIVSDISCDTSFQPTCYFPLTRLLCLCHAVLQQWTNNFFFFFFLTLILHRFNVQSSEHFHKCITDINESFIISVD